MVRTHRSEVAGFDIVTIVSGEALNENCYLVLDRSSGDLAIIDPGMGVPAILDAIRELERQPKYLLITHGHPDHIAGAADLANEFELDCMVSSADKRTLHNAPGYAAAFGMEAVRVPERLRLLDGSEDLRLGLEPIRVTAMPGHTPGSVAFRMGHAVFTGDTLFRGNVGRTDFPGSDPMALVESIDGLIAEAPADSVVLPGHGQPWTIAEASAWWSGRGRADSLARAASKGAGW